MASSEKSSTLEDFIKTYIGNKARSSTAESYEEWLKKNGVNSEKIYADSIKDIKADYERAKAGYGRKAEGLASLGLTASGYSDYLASSAYSLMQRRKSGAQDKYSENEFKNRSAYANYIRELNEAEEKAYKSAVNTITNEGITDYEEAYKYAIGIGLSDANAQLAAKSASDAAKRNLRISVIKSVISRGFNERQAREYALAFGFSEDEADELASYAGEINKYSHYDSDYLEYLKNKSESQNSQKN